MAKIITIFNQKGGVGKTTTVVNLSSALAKLNKKILVVDLDPQANTTSGLGIEKKSNNNIYDLLINENEEVILKTKYKNLDLINSSGDLAGIEIELARNENWQYTLQKGLMNIKNNYDYIIIDSPPSLGILSIIALTASNSIIIPVQSEYYSLEGLGQLMDTMSIIKKSFNPHLYIEGIVLCMYDSRNNLSLQVANEVQKFFETKLYSNYIPKNVRLAEAPSFGMNIFEYDDKSKGAISYMKLAMEFLKREN